MVCTKNITLFIKYFLHNKRWKDHGQQALMDKWVREQGHDGISHTGGHNIGAKDHKVWIAFEPNQIKSTSNQGTFDKDTNHMLKSHRKRVVIKALNRA